MRFCLQLSVCFFSCLAAAEAASAAGPAFVKQTVVPPRVRSVVRADTRTGRLVRTVVVSPRVVPPVVVASGEPTVAPHIDPNASVPEIVEATARKYDVDPLLVHSVIQVESGYNPYAVSPKGAQGLMQLMPGTARRFGVSNTFDLRDNIEGGVRYLKYLQTLFPHDLRLAVAAYNAGEGAVWKYNNRIPPYRETESYVYLVGKKYGQALKRAAQEKKLVAAPVRRAAAEPQGPVYAPIEQYIDSEGRLHLRTAPVDASGGGSAVSTP